MFYRLVSYARFLSKSTNHHGVHSPFIYDFVTTVFYNKKKKNQKYSGKVALFKRLFEHLNIQSMTTLGKVNREMKQLIEAQNIKYFPLTDIKNKTIDCLYITKKTNTNNITKDAIFNILHNNSVIIFEKAYHDKNSALAWEKLANHVQATAVVDSFYYGFIFLRKEQKKQTFTIRM
jgi:lysozyme family protein